MTANGNRPTPGTFDDVVRAIATLEVSIGGIAKGQESIKIELKTIAPRLDTLSADVSKLAKRVHDFANVITVLTDETAELAQAKNAFEKALADFRLDTEVRARELEHTQSALEHALSLAESRLRTVRDEVADMSASLREDESSGVIDKPRM